jgi:hypothetical protein
MLKVLFGRIVVELLRACFLNVILRPKAEESLQSRLANSRFRDSAGKLMIVEATPAPVHARGLRLRCVFELAVCHR